MESQNDDRCRESSGPDSRDLVAVSDEQLVYPVVGDDALRQRSNTEQKHRSGEREDDRRAQDPLGDHRRHRRARLG